MRPLQRSRPKPHAPLGRLSRLSRVLHRWLGLGLVAYLGWMGASGILLNHPDWIRGLTVPERLVPPQYRFADWSRGALRTLTSVPGRPGALLAAGSLGVFRSEDGGSSFRSFNSGLGSLYERNTNQVLALSGADGPLLLAATRGGLRVRAAEDERWRSLELGDGRPVVKLVEVGERLIAFTDSGAWVSPRPPAPIRFVRARLARAEAASRVPLAEALFALHSGEAWGLPGRLVYDLVGLVVVVLSASALVTWSYSKLRGRLARARRWMRGLVAFLFRYHLKLGIWAAALLLLIGVTGMFMRPPLLVLVGEATVPRWTYPAALPESPWAHRIRNATYDASGNRLLVQASDGVWEGSADLAESFRRVELPAPIFAMGATVFEADASGGLEVGSFAGLFRLGPDGRAIDRMTGEPAPDRGAMRPGPYLITGSLLLPGGVPAITTHYEGLLALDGTPLGERLPMPSLDGAAAGMPLWNFLFELHNGRIFRDLIGGWYVLIVPLGGLALVLLAATGVWDWALPRWRARRAARRA